MLARSVILLLVFACPMAAGQSAVDQWIQSHYEAVGLYRNGNTSSALTLLGSMSADEQKKAIEAIIGQVAAIAAGRTVKKVIPWPANTLRALGALHMEAALVSYASIESDGPEIARHHIDLAKAVFKGRQELTRGEDHSAARWILAIALDHMAEARLNVAAGLLGVECREQRDFGPLLVACGSIHETYASLPAAHGLVQQSPLHGPLQPDHSVGASLRILSSMSAPQRLGAARNARRGQLSLARKYLERALALDSADTEASLRLGNVRMQQGDHQEAAAIFERLLKVPALDARASYLAHLFLARVRNHQNQLDEAAAILARSPEVQSSLLARAHNSVRRGNTREAAMYVERSTKSDSDDPWWGYRYAQYWLRGGLFRQLRAEARQ